MKSPSTRYVCRGPCKGSNERGRQLEAALELQPKGMRVSRRIVIKVCSVVSVGLIAYAALGPANWQLRPMLGWKTEHFLGFLIVTFIACVAWPRPLIVGLALMATAGLLEALQGLTPDRVPDLPTALCGAGGALLASVAAEVFIRARSPTRPVELSADSPQKGPKDRYMTEVESWREIQSSNVIQYRIHHEAAAGADREGDGDR